MLASSKKDVAVEGGRKDGSSGGGLQVVMELRFCAREEGKVRWVVLNR